LVDAVFETRHFTAAYLQNNEGRVLVPAQEVTKATGSIGAVPVVTTAAEIDSSPEVVQSFVTAWAKAMKYIQQDPDDAAHLLQIYLHRQGARVTPEIAGAWVRLTKYNQYGWSKAAVTDAEYNGWALNVGNILKVQPKLAEYIDNSYMDKAVKQIGLQ
jgi:ABC-type nitrate/sulfonate/bicarbonate transport system substrate-binding protein